MMVDSITKLVNNVSSDVMQKNSATAASAAGASNSLNLMAIECDTVTISNVNQGAQSTNQTTVKTSQSNTSTISNDISTNIDKKRLMMLFSGVMSIFSFRYHNTES